MKYVWKSSLAALLASVLALPVMAQTQDSSTTMQQGQSASVEDRSRSALRGGQYDQQILQAVNSELKKHDWAEDIRVPALKTAS